MNWKSNSTSNNSSSKRFTITTNNITRIWIRARHTVYLIRHWRHFKRMRFNHISKDNNSSSNRSDWAEIITTAATRAMIWPKWSQLAERRCRRATATSRLRDRNRWIWVLQHPLSVCQRRRHRRHRRVAAVSAHRFRHGPMSVPR